jgi:hypothetical protein
MAIILKLEAQNTSDGNISITELSLKKYDKDPTAEAVVLSDEGTSSFHLTEYNGFEVIFEKKTRIKVFSKAGIKWSEIEIPFYQEGNTSENIYDLAGATYNMVNGTSVRTELNIKNTFTEKTGENWYVKKFAMPDVKEGSEIYFTYKLSTPFLHNFRSWEFQNRIPVEYSKYTTRMIPFYEYRYVLQGTNKFDSFNSHVDEFSVGRLNGIEYKDMVYEFVMKDIPAFKDESYITSIEDYIIKLDFQLSTIHYPDGRNKEVMSTWPKLSEEMLDNEDFGKYIKYCSKKSKEITGVLNLDSKSELEKAKSIDRYIKENFNWNGSFGKFASKNPKEFISGKTGNIADINLYLIGMLNSAGIEAYPVLISTRAHGKIKVDYPFHQFFNYVIALANIGGNLYLMDATEPFCSFAEIPYRCINDKGFIVQKNKTEWVNLKSSKAGSMTDYRFNWTMNSSCDSINGKCQMATFGYDAVGCRNKYVKSLKSLKSSLGGSNGLSDSIKALNLKEIEKSFEISYGLKNQVEKIEDKLAITLFPNVILTENPLKQPVRNYPVDMVYSSANSYQAIIKIPKGYKLYAKPDDLNIENALVKISYASEIKNDEIKVVGTYEFKKDVYNSQNYNDIKSYFNKIIDKFNEKLILVKV